ncbi:hypothetical protein AOLI_G00175930 [Acnodon oligacanthus]
MKLRKRCHVGSKSWESRTLDGAFRLTLWRVINIDTVSSCSAIAIGLSSSAWNLQPVSSGLVKQLHQHGLLQPCGRSWAVHSSLLTCSLLSSLPNIHLHLLLSEPEHQLHCPLTTTLSSLQPRQDANGSLQPSKGSMRLKGEADFSRHF